MAEITRLEKLRELHRRDPKDSFSAYGLAMELVKSPATVDEAILLFRRLIEEPADYLPAYFQLGRLLERRGEAEEARKIYQKGVALAVRVGDDHTREELEAAIASL